MRTGDDACRNRAQENTFAELGRRIPTANAPATLHPDCPDE
ncbi:hypothetical protein HMPREF0724_12630 [Prescottella equi ATCC 33707]|uniref:Uncharacterized protein n=1 Tax=Prescottella equi ATCC 33707 TaxID=525370 RepID=E9T253_RHOHA|nr:hypothetical protein HMPREF0724_12630 [Prescottella equi ATCC 33707]